MANDIKIDLSLTGEHAVARGLDNVGDKAEHAGGDLNKMAKEAGFLDKRLLELRGSTRQLAAEFARTGDKDIFAKLQGSKRELGQLEAVKKEFFDIGDKLGDQTRKGFLESFGEMGTNLRGAMSGAMAPAIGGAVLLGAAIAPFVGAAVASAVLGGAGIGGVVGGIMLAAKDARVQDEAVKLGQHMSEAFTKSAEPFIAPIIEALHIVDSATDGVAGSMRQAFATVAPVLAPLTKGLVGLVEHMMPGLIKGLEAAKPVLRVIANELPEVGDALSDMFEDLSEDPDGAIMAMKTLFQITTGTIRAVGAVFGFLEKAFEKTQKAGIETADIILKIADALGINTPAMNALRQMRDNWQAQVDAMNAGKDASHDFAGGLDDVADSASAARTKMAALDSALKDFLDLAKDSEDANIAYERTWDDMIETLTEGKRTLDITTEAGRKNRESVEAHADAIRQRHEDRMKHNMSLAESLPIMDAEIERMRKELLLLGYNKQAADALVNTYIKWPTKAVTVIEAQGLVATKEGIAELVSMFQLLNTVVTVGGIGGAKVGKRAAGGPVYAGQTYVVGENGPELLQMGSANGNVTNATQTAAMMSGASGGAARPVVNMTWVPSGNAAWDALVQAIWPYILKQVRVDGGDLTVFGASFSAA